MVNIGTLKQSNGTQLPLLGYGTWLSNNPEQLKVALRAALDAGYRYIDTAFVYENEQVIGEVLQEFYDAGKLKRSDLWITTKLALHMFRPEYVKEGIQYSLKALRTDYIDLYLMHTPTPCKYGEDLKPVMDANAKLVPDLVPHIETWRVLEKYYKEGTLKSIGVSNFNVQQLQDLYDKAEVKPHNLQVEIHILHPPKELVNLCKKLGITVTSYGTLGSPGRNVGFKQVGAKDERAEKQPEADCLGHPLVVELAKKYNKTPAQILLRQMIQREISVIPKSTNAERVRENFNVLDFELSGDEMKKFDEIKEDIRLFTFFFVDHHPWWPFKQQ